MFVTISVIIYYLHFLICTHDLVFCTNICLSIYRKVFEQYTMVHTTWIFKWRNFKIQCHRGICRHTTTPADTAMWATERLQSIHYCALCTNTKKLVRFTATISIINNQRWALNFLGIILRIRFIAGFFNNAQVFPTCTHQLQSFLLFGSCKWRTGQRRGTNYPFTQFICVGLDILGWFQFHT